jgi:hypothetical protein
LRIQKQLFQQLTFFSSSISLPSTLSSQQVVAEPSGAGAGAPGSPAGVGAAAPGVSLAGKAVLEMKIRSFRFCFIGRFRASWKARFCFISNYCFSKNEINLFWLFFIQAEIAFQ